jgi:hypothetical protein
VLRNAELVQLHDIILKRSDIVLAHLWDDDHLTSPIVLHLAISWSTRTGLYFMYMCVCVCVRRERERAKLQILVNVLLFIYYIGLCNDAFSSCGYLASTNRMISE